MNMNNNQMNFDPTTGKPINNNQAQNTPINTVPTIQPTVENVQPVQPIPVQVEPQVVTVEPQPTIQQPTNNAYINPQQQMQGIATVEQNKQEFIQNTQASNLVKKEEKKDGPNITFIIFLFVIILVAILFLFPYLMKVLG